MLSSVKTEKTKPEIKMGGARRRVASNFLPTFLFPLNIFCITTQVTLAKMNTSVAFPINHTG